MSLASFLPSYGSEHQVLRAAVLSIVMTLAVGQNAALLCRAWCESQAADASGCHHEQQASSTSVSADDICDHVVLSLAAVLREDVRRGVFAPDADYAILVSRYQLAPSKTDPRPRHQAARERSLEQRPLSTTLRV